jgi:YD repeat-containing protein
LGCAGGEVVTLTDEGTLVNGVNKRRQQTLHHDVLGRLVKTEVWDFEGTGSDGVSRRLYSTTVTSYNVRDQVTLVRKYAGAESSSTVQETSMTYDGFGRLETQHMPQQQAVPNQSWTSDHTTYHYDAEAKVDYVIDARGVKKQFSYANNNRHLVTGLSYDLSALPAGQTSVPATSAATFEYNAVGLRTKVTDSTGTITYTYNDLSQLTSEARVFAEFPNQTYTLNY